MMQNWRAKEYKRIILLGICWVCMVFNCQIYAQEEEEVFPAIKGFARNYGDSISIRWSPNKVKLWEAGKKYGYDIYKTVLKKGSQKVTSLEIQKVNLAPLMMQPQEYWEMNMDNSREMQLAATALFGEGTPQAALPPGIVGSYYAGIEREGKMIYAFMAADLDINVAKAEGLYFVDKNIDTSYTYLYTIALADKSSDSTYQVGSILVDAGRQLIVPQIQEVKAKPKEHQIYVSWQSDYDGLAFTSFDVFRSTEWDKGYQKLNTAPIINAHSVEDGNPNRLAYVDTVPALLTSYYYIVVGKTLFGDYGPYNVPVEAYPIPTLKAAPALSYTEIIDSVFVKLNWGYDDDKLKHVKGFMVKRAEKDSGPFKPISGELSKDTRTFQDNSPMYNNYYRVVAYNEWGDTLHSMTRFAQILDTDPPKMPTGLVGEIDSAGVVTLRWDKNTDDDLLGYRIYSSNYKNDEFSRVTPGHVTDTMFVDTVSIKTLTRAVYYNMIAIDKRFNPSKFTEPIKIIRPDIIPPSPPVIKNFESSTRGIKLEWYGSSSEDVKYHEVWRQVVGGTAPELVYRSYMNGIEMTFSDTTSKAGYKYQYQVIAVDGSDLKSTPAGPVTLERVKSYLKPPITEVRSDVNKKKRIIKLGWKYEQFGIKHFLLYRAVGDNKMSIYKNIDAKDREFYDQDLKMKTAYAYRLKAVFEDGSESPFTDPILLEVN